MRFSIIFLYSSPSSKTCKHPHFIPTITSILSTTVSKIKIIPLLHSQNPLYDILPYKLHSHQSKRHPSYKPECHKSISIFYYQITLNIFCFKGLSSLSEIPISFLAFSNPCIVVVKHFCNTCG